MTTWSKTIIAGMGSRPATNMHDRDLASRSPVSLGLCIMMAIQQDMHHLVARSFLPETHRVHTHSWPHAVRDLSSVIILCSSSAEADVEVWRRPKQQCKRCWSTDIHLIHPPTQSLMNWTSESPLCRAYSFDHILKHVCKEGGLTIMHEPPPLPP